MSDSWARICLRIDFLLMRMFNSAYNQSHSSDRGYSTSNHNPRALLGSGNTYWSNANRNDGQTTGIGTTQRSGSDLNGVGSSTTAGSGGSGRSGKTMTWASVASQPTVKPIKAHSLRSKMANSSSSGSSLASFSSTGAKSLPPPIVTPPISSVPPPISSVPPPVAQPPPNPPMVHSQPTLDPNLRPRDVGLNQPASFSSPPSNASAPTSVVSHPLLGSRNSGPLLGSRNSGPLLGSRNSGPLLGSRNSGMGQQQNNSGQSSGVDRPPYSSHRNDRDGYTRYNNPENGTRTSVGGGSAYSGHPPPASSWQPPHQYRNFQGNESHPYANESVNQRYHQGDVHHGNGNGNGYNQQTSITKIEPRAAVSSSKSLASSSPSSSATSSSIRSTASSVTDRGMDRESSESSPATGTESSPATGTESSPVTGTESSITRSLNSLKLEPVVKVDKIDEILHQFNPEKFDLNPINARFFVIKSYSEDDIHRSIKYSIWCSTDHGNKRLDIAYKAQQSSSGGPVYLFYSVNGSGHFCGMAQMISPVDYNSTVSVWAQDKWKGQFKVKWIYVKDVPNSQLRHIRLENNENKPVTNSRDTQEVPPEKGKQVLGIIHSYSHTTSIFDDFMHYEKRQEEESMNRKGDAIVPPSGHSTHNREREARQQNGAGGLPSRDGTGTYSRDNYGDDGRGGQQQFHNNNPRGDRPGFDRPGFDRPGFDRPGFDRPSFDRSQQPYDHQRDHNPRDNQRDHNPRDNQRDHNPRDNQRDHNPRDNSFRGVSNQQHGHSNGYQRGDSNYYRGAPPRDHQDNRGGGGFNQQRNESGYQPREYQPRDNREYKPREYQPREYQTRDNRSYQSREDRPREDRPREDRPREDRPREDRPREDRPREDRPREDRPREDHRPPANNMQQQQRDFHPREAVNRRQLEPW